MGTSDPGLLEKFVAAFGVWDLARPYLDLMVTEPEMRLVVAMDGRSMTAEGVAAALDIPSRKAVDLLQRSCRRCIVDRQVEDGVLLYQAAGFYPFVDEFAKFENWDEIPPEGREAIDRRCLAEFIALKQPDVERKLQGLAAENALPDDTVMLLDEVEAMLDAATDIVVQPCDCRRLGQNCDRPVETCIWLDESARETLDRGRGRRLSKKEAKALLRWADKKGLMHTADSAWRTNGLHAICNCCACDCYPFRAAQELGSKGVWPQSRYIAVYSAELCNLCGACVRRCHFDAFYHDESTAEVDGKSMQNLLYDPEKCWGCGLCANGCPSGAIVMKKLKELSR